MARLLLALLVGLVGALIVHIGVIFAMPRMAEDNVWARLSRIMAPLQPTLVADGGLAAAQATGPNAVTFGFLDPAFAVAACRFSLGEGPVLLSAEEGAGFWSASIDARSGDNLYSINERLAPAGRLALLVGTQDQLDEARLDGVLAEEDAIAVAVTAGEAYLTFRVLVESESRRPFADRLVRSLACQASAPAPDAT